MPQVKFKIEIIMDEEGRIGVSGPLDMKTLCLGMIEQAKYFIQTFEPKKQEKPHIIPVTGVLPKVNGH